MSTPASRLRAAVPTLAHRDFRLAFSGQAIALDAASFVASAVCLALMSGATVVRAEHEPVGKFVAQVKEGWREVSSRRWLRSFMVVVADRELDGASS